MQIQKVADYVRWSMEWRLIRRKNKFAVGLLAARRTCVQGKQRRSVWGHVRRQNFSSNMAMLFTRPVCCFQYAVRHLQLRKSKSFGGPALRSCSQHHLTKRKKIQETVERRRNLFHHTKTSSKEAAYVTCYDFSKFVLLNF